MRIPLFKIIDNRTNVRFQRTPENKLKKKLKQTPEERHRRLANIMIENFTAKKPKSKLQMAKEAGFASSSPVNSPVVQNIIKPVLDQFKDLRQNALNELKLKNLQVVDYKELVDATDKLTKNIQLLSGEATDNSKITFGWLTDDDNDDGTPKIPPQQSTPTSFIEGETVTPNIHEENSLSSTEVGATTP